MLPGEAKDLGDQVTPITDGPANAFASRPWNARGERTRTPGPTLGRRLVTAGRAEPPPIPV